MKKQSQLELFKFKQYQSDKIKKSEYRRNFFGFIRIHEKTISVTIVFFIISLISFSLGVEKGKRLTSQIQRKNPEPMAVAGRLSEDKSKDDKKDISEYTIQVASFKTRTYAQKEVKRLEKQGLQAEIIPRGRHVSVCVGNFPRKQDAKIPLNRLKQTYHDCFIRKL